MAKQSWLTRQSCTTDKHITVHI